MLRRTIGLLAGTTFFFLLSSVWLQCVVLLAYLATCVGICLGRIVFFYLQMMLTVFGTFFVAYIYLLFLIVNE